MVRASAVLPEPVVPAISTWATLGLGNRSSSGTPSWSRPRTAVCAGIISRPRATSRWQRGSRGTTLPLARGTSTSTWPWWR